MDNDPAVRAKSGRWGSACSSCAGAKAKCIRSNEAPGMPCDRCQRLSKECTNQIHRPRKKRASKPSRTAQLERRLNGLVDLLRATGELPPSHSGGQTAAESADSPSLDGASIDRLSTHATDPSQKGSPVALDIGLQGGTITLPSIYNCHAPARCICRVTVDSAPAQSAPDGRLLANYRTHLSSVFPFVVIPSDMDPARLKSERPFVWAAIKKVSTMDSMPSMHAQMYALILHLSDHLLVRSERSLDLLQGIIVVLGWFQHHCMIHSQMNNLVHLAASLIADLGLNRPPLVQERTAALMMDPEEPPPRTNDERRALLGVWYLTSSISIGFQKIDSMKFSPYIQQCLRELEEAAQYESDTFLVYSVKLQSLTQQIHDTNLRCNDAEDIPGIPRAPASAYQRAFQAELDRIQESLPVAIKDNIVVTIQIRTVSLHLYEPPVIDAALLRKLGSSLTEASTSLPSSLDVFYQSGRALRLWFENFLSLHTERYVWLPQPSCAHLIHAITMLVRWAKLVGPVALRRDRVPTERVFPPARTIHEPSSRSPVPGTRFGAGLAPAPDFDASGQVRPSPSDLSRGDQHTSEVNPASMPAAVAALKATLFNQPELNVDVIGILEALMGRFEQINAEMIKGWGGIWHNSIWDLSLKKMKIIRTKLLQWAEMTPANEDEGNKGKEMNNAGGIGVHHGDSFSTAGLEPRVSENAVSSQVAHNPDLGAPVNMACMPNSLAGWDYDTSWSDSLFDQVESTFWVDTDWGAILTQQNQDH